MWAEAQSILSLPSGAREGSRMILFNAQPPCIQISQMLTILKLTCLRLTFL
jgi:hypothetical protein